MNHALISVLDFGAQPDHPAVQTAAFQAAMDALARLGGGTVEVPAGSYIIGSVRLYSNTCLHLFSGAKLYGSRDPEDYTLWEGMEALKEEQKTQKCWEPHHDSKPRCYDFLKAGGRWCHGMLRAVNAENISIIGEPGAVIDGRDCYDPLGEEEYRGPHGISIQHCQGLLFRGYTVRNTGNWAHCITDCRDILMENVTAEGGHDGIHCTSCANIRIHGSAFYTGDDCIAGFANENTLVTDCICNTACSGLRFGGTNALIRNTRFYGPAKFFFRGSLSLEEKRSGAQAHRPHRVNMLSVFTYYAHFSTPIPLEPGNIRFEDCQAENVDRFLHYNFSGNERWQSHRPLRSLSFRRIHASGIGMPLTAYGSADCPLILELEDLDIRFREDAPPTPFLHCAHIEALHMKNVAVHKPADTPLIKTWTRGGKLECCNVSYGLPQEQWVSFTQEPFLCQSI